MTEPSDQPVLAQDRVDDEASPITDGLVDADPSDQGRSPRTFGPWSSVVLAFPVAAVAEVGFLFVSALLLPDGGGSGSEYIWLGLLPFIIGAAAISQVVIGLVLGAIFRTMPALLGVAGGVPVGVGLGILVDGSKADVRTIAILSFFLLLVVVPGYAVGATIRARRGRTHPSHRPPPLAPFLLLPGLGIVVGLALLRGGSPPAYEGPSRPAVAADQTQTVTITGTSISVEPPALTFGSVDVELRWPDYSTAYTLEIVGPLEPSHEVRLGHGDIEWRVDFYDFNRPTSGPFTAESYQSFGPDMDGYLGRLDLSPGRYSWLVYETVHGQVEPGVSTYTENLLAWIVFSVE